MFHPFNLSQFRLDLGLPYHGNLHILIDIAAACLEDGRLGDLSLPNLYLQLLGRL